MHVVELRGWALSAVARIDVEVPGFAGHFLRAGAERRQAIAAALSRMSDVEAAQAAKSFLTAKTREIIISAFGACPHGLLGALAKAGHQPHSAAFYHKLYRIFDAPRRRPNAARCIQQLRTISEAKLGSITKLPEVLRLPTLVESLPTAEDASGFVWLWRRLLQAGTSERELLHSLRQASRVGSLDGFAETWASRIDFPACPIPRSERFRPLANGREVKREALRFRNCAAEMLPSLLDGRRHLGIFTCTDAVEVIVEMRRTDNGVFIDDVHGFQNGTVATTHRREVLRFGTAHGVASRFATARSPWAVLHRLGLHSLRWKP
jgi:hypothetical protein